MKRGILLVALAALTLIAAGCKKTNNPAGASEGETVVNERNPATDEMGHIGNSKIETGRNNNSSTFSIFDTPWKGEIFYQGGSNKVTYYENGTFEVSWSGTNDCAVYVGYYYGNPGVNPDGLQYDCYFRHSKTGSAGGYNYIGVHGWTVDPLVEFFIIDDWYNKPSPGILGQKMGDMVLDGDTYEIYKGRRVQSPSIQGTRTFPQYFAVRSSARLSGHINASAHLKKFESLGMELGNIYELKYFIEVGGGTGSFDCTYFFLSDGKI